MGRGGGVELQNRKIGRLIFFVSLVSREGKMFCAPLLNGWELFVSSLFRITLT